MKKLNSIKTILFLSGLSAMTLSSCLKDTLYDEGKIQSVNPGNATNSKFIEIGLTGTSTRNFLVLALNSSNTDTTFNLIPVILASGEPASEDVNVTLVKDDALVTAYNTANGTNFQVPPSNLYTIVNPGNVVTIPKGSNTGYLQIKIKPSAFLGTEYALGYKIGSVDKQGYTISGNLNNGIAGITIKNKYDGIYSIVSGTVTRYTAPGAPANDALSGSVAANPDVTLTTVGANTVEITNLRWANGQGVAGIDNLQATVDPATNLVTMQALGNATLSNWAGHENKYDPVTKTFYLAFIWNPTANVRTYEIVIKYKGPR